MSMAPRWSRSSCDTAFGRPNRINTLISCCFNVLSILEVFAGQVANQGGFKGRPGGLDTITGRSEPLYMCLAGQPYPGERAMGGQEHIPGVSLMIRGSSCGIRG
jgi:hypothetical protein